VIPIALSPHMTPYTIVDFSNVDAAPNIIVSQRLSLLLHLAANTVCSTFSSFLSGRGIENAPLFRSGLLPCVMPLYSIHSPLATHGVSPTLATCVFTCTPRDSTASRAISPGLRLF
jgi:hypothetical protein